MNAFEVCCHYDISVRMIKSCMVNQLLSLCQLYSKIALIMAFFLIFGRNRIFFSVHKKGDKQIIDNYRPVFLLLICGKIFKNFLFNSIYEFLDDNNLLSSNQSGLVYH